MNRPCLTDSACHTPPGCRLRTLGDFFANPAPVLLVGHVLRLKQAVVLALLVVASVAQGDPEGIETRTETPRVPCDEEGGLVLLLWLDVGTADAFANAWLGLEDILGYAR